jgi:hypothetical protein
MAMRNPRRDSLVGSVDRVVLGGLAVSLLTSVHHYYGAYVYKTPWRRHAALVSGLATAAALGSLLVLRRRTTGLADAVAFWFLTADTLVVHVGGFGVFEGGYNHLLKDVLYLGGASPALLRRLFPAPRYSYLMMRSSRSPGSCRSSPQRSPATTCIALPRSA